MESPLAFGLVLVSVFFSSAYTLLKKVSCNRLVFFGAVNGLTALIALPLLFLVPLPNIEVLPFILASSLVYNGKLYFIHLAYERADLSVVTPLSEAVSFMLIVLSAKMVLGEVALWYEWFSIGIIFMAIMMQMNMRAFHKIHHAMPFLLIGVVGIFDGLQVLIDIMGIRAAANPFSFIVALMFIGLPSTFWAFIRHRHEIKMVLSIQKSQIITASLLDTVGYGCFLYAVYVARALYAVPLSVLGVVVVTCLGLYHLKEMMRFRRLLSATMIAIAIAGVHLLDIVYR